MIRLTFERGFYFVLMILVIYLIFLILTVSLNSGDERLEMESSDSTTTADRAELGWENKFRNLMWGSQATAIMSWTE